MFGKLKKRMEEERSETTIEAEMNIIKSEFPKAYAEVEFFLSEMIKYEYKEETKLSNIIFQKKELRKTGKTRDCKTPWTK